MSEANVVFTLDGVNLAIRCTTEDKMEDICKKYSTKINKNMNSLLFSYGGNKINFDLSFKEYAGNNHEIKILVNKNESDIFICPKCDEKTNLNIEKLDELKLSNDKIKDNINIIKLHIKNIIKTSSVNSLVDKFKNINKILIMVT